MPFAPLVLAKELKNVFGGPSNAITLMAEGQCSIKLHLDMTDFRTMFGHD